MFMIIVRLIILSGSRCCFTGTFLPSAALSLTMNIIAIIVLIILITVLGKCLFFKFFYCSKCAGGA
jgi:hypothetical protein